MATNPNVFFVDIAAKIKDKCDKFFENCCGWRKKTKNEKKYERRRQRSKIERKCSKKQIAPISISSKTSKIKHRSPIKITSTKQDTQSSQIKKSDDIENQFPNIEVTFNDIISPKTQYDMEYISSDDGYNSDNSDNSDNFIIIQE